MTGSQSKRMAKCKNITWLYSCVCRTFTLTSGRNARYSEPGLSGSEGFELKAAPVKLDLFPVYLVSIVLDSIAVISMFEDRQQCQNFSVLYMQNGYVIKAPSQHEQIMHVLHTVQNKT